MFGEWFKGSEGGLSLSKNGDLTISFGFNVSYFKMLVERSPYSFGSQDKLGILELFSATFYLGDPRGLISWKS